MAWRRLYTTGRRDRASFSWSFTRLAPSTADTHSMTANINELRLRLSMRRSSSTSFRLSPWVSTLPQMAPMAWAAYHLCGQPGSGSASRRPVLRAAHGCAGDLCVRTRGWMRSVAPAPVCLGRAARPDPYGIYERCVARAIGPEASGDRPSAWSCTVVGKLRGAGATRLLALGRGARAPVRHATDTSKAVGDGHRSSRKTLPSFGGCPPLLQGLPITGVQSCASVRRRFLTPAQLGARAARQQRQARANPCRRRRAEKSTDATTQ